MSTLCPEIRRGGGLLGGIAATVHILQLMPRVSILQHQIQLPV